MITMRSEYSPSNEPELLDDDYAKMIELGLYLAGVDASELKHGGGAAACSVAFLESNNITITAARAEPIPPGHYPHMVTVINNAYGPVVRIERPLDNEGVRP